jgi:hypothetical protein
MRTAKEEWIAQRADELWTAEGRRPEREQACWDKAVQEYEAGTSEAQRSQVQPDPATEGDTGEAPVLPPSAAETEGGPDEASGDLPEENDDNPDQVSDEALPDDEEEKAMRHDLGGAGIRYEPE